MSNIPHLFDQRALAARRARAFARYGTDADFLLKEAVGDMCERLSMILRDFPVCLELGGHHGPLAKALSQRAGTKWVMRLEQDISAFKERDLGAVFDPDALPLPPASVNLVVSPLFLHWVNDLPGLLLQIRQCLKPDGLFLATMLGRESLSELRHVFLQADSEIVGGASPRVAPMPDIRDMGALLQRAGFALPVVDQDQFTVRYDSLFELARDLRRMGATNALADRSRTFMRRETLMRAAELYQQQFADPDGRIRATFQILSLSGWAPDDSQQKPLRPGSAKRSLASVLGDKS